MTATTGIGPSDPLPESTVDAVVIGGGAAGLNGALMLARSRRSVVVIDGGDPRNAPAAAVHGLLGGIAGVRLADGRLVARRVLAVATSVHARTEGLESLRLPAEDLPGGLGRRVTSGQAGVTGVPGVWVAGNATEPFAQVGASAAAGAMAGAHLNADLAAADADDALARCRVS